MPSTISDPQFKAIVLTSTLTTALLTAATGTRIKITHITISNGATAGTITLSRLDNSSSVVARILNAAPILGNASVSGSGFPQPFEFTEFYLEAGDELRGGATTTTDAEISIDYYTITL